MIISLVVAPFLSPTQEFDFERRRLVEAFGRSDYQAADAHLERILELRPNFPQALFNRATLAAARNDAEGALFWLRRVADVGAHFDIEPFAELLDSDFLEIENRLDRNIAPKASGTIAYALSRPDFIPEGIAYDQKRRRMLVGSIRHREIISVESDLSERQFVAAGTQGLGSVMGMQADPTRNRLWVASSSTSQMRPESATEFTGIWAFRLSDGAYVTHYPLPSSQTPSRLGDVLLSDDGRLFASDSLSGAVFELDPERGEFRTVIAPGALRSAQGMAISADGRFLYVADYASGLHALDLDTGALIRLRLANDVHDYGIDGLYRMGDSLIGIQNLIRPHRVVRYALGDDGMSITDCRILEASLPEFSEPTLGVPVGDTLLYVANSQWDKFDEENELPSLDQLRAPIIRRIPVGSSPDE